MRRSTSVGLAAALALAMLTAAPVTAKEYKMTAGSSHPPILPWVVTIKDLVVPESNKRLKELGIGDSITWTEAYAGALYNFDNTLEGVGQGLADIGWVGSLWETVKMPLHNVSYYTPFTAGDYWALLDIQEELYRSIPAMQKEWTDNGVVLLGAQTADTYHIVSKTPIRSVEDLKGKKFNTAGAVGTWLNGTGAVAVQSGLPEFYNNIKTGVADGAVILMTRIPGFKLHEVAPYVTLVDMGAVFSGGLGMNKKTFDSLPPHMKALFRGLGREYAFQQTRLVQQNEKSAFARIQKEGAKVSTLPESERKKWAAMLPDIAGDWAKQWEAKGIPAKQVLKTYMEMVRKRGGAPMRDWDKGL